MKKNHKDDHRKYYYEDREIPSCTTIVSMLGKPELVKWANYMGFKRINTSILLEDRAAYGTFCHKLFEVYFSNGLITANSNTEFIDKAEFREIIYRIHMVELYFKKLKIRTLAVELPMEGKTYGGTLDMICYNEIEDCIMIFDLKTSKEVRQSHWIQLMGYAQLVGEVYHLPVKEVGIILLSKPLRSPELINIRETKDCWRELFVFNKLRDAYYILNEPEEVVNKLIEGVTENDTRK